MGGCFVLGHASSFVVGGRIATQKAGTQKPLPRVLGRPPRPIRGTSGKRVKPPSSQHVRNNERGKQPRPCMGGQAKQCSYQPLPRPARRSGLDRLSLYQRFPEWVEFDQ